MKYIYYITFISAIIVLGWIFRPVEHMSNGTCKRPIYGPTGMDGKSYPEVYGPDGVARSVGKGKQVSNSATNNTEDDGEFGSNTATRNPAYMNVFTFKPFAKTNFPVLGPPEPYLSDFANFHK